MHRFETQQLHAGRMIDVLNSCAVPVYETASFAFNDADHGVRLFEFTEFGNIYSRIGNPTVAVFQNRMAALEGGVAAIGMASGTACVFSTMTALTKAGDNFVSASTVHGGTVHQYKVLAPQMGLECRFVKTQNPADFAAQIDEKTKFLFVETISNPKYEVPDFEGLAKVAQEHGIPLICDNTFGCGGYVSSPLRHGVDIVIHSATKWIGGHGTTLGGVIVDGGKFDWGAQKEKFPQFHGDSADSGSGELSLWKMFGKRAFAMRVQFEILRDVGASLSPSSAQQLLIGMETLSLRAERHSQNAAELARWLAEQPEVGWVSYLGQPDHPSHENAKKYIRYGFGSMLSFGIKGGKRAGFRLCDNLGLIINTTNLGDAKTLIVHPWSTTHQQLTDAERHAAGVTEDHMRVSVGIEHVEDLKADFRQAFDRLNEDSTSSAAAVVHVQEQRRMINEQFAPVPVPASLPAPESAPSPPVVMAAAPPPAPAVPVTVSA